MKIKICGDSTCDLTQELIAKYDIGIMPLIVTLGETSFLDGVTIAPEDIYKFYKSKKQLPKSAARSAEDYQEFFEGFLKDGYDAVIHFNISQKMSMSHENAVSASKKLKNVFVVDSANLSTGTALLMLYACDLKDKGLSASQIFDKVLPRVKSVQASFVIDTLEFLHKGGRCSSVAFVGANLLGLKPSIVVEDGAMGVGKKYMGRYQRVIKKYVVDVLEKFNNPDKTRCFVTHTKMAEGICEQVVGQLKEMNIFAEIWDTTAGCTITTHCGEGTLGILFINDGGAE